MSALLTRVEQVLNALALEHGADYVAVNYYGATEHRPPFYSINLHNDRIVRSGDGATVAEALAKAIAAPGFDANPDREAA